MSSPSINTDKINELTAQISTLDLQSYFQLFSNMVSGILSMIFILIGSKEDVKEQVKLLSDNAMVPTRATAYSACKDLYSPIDETIEPGEQKLIMTDVALAWSGNYYVQLLSRSGLANKHKISVEAGVIDKDYRKNIGVILRNQGTSPFVVNKGDRIAQYTFVKIAGNAEATVVTEFQDLESNRTGGFGSTGGC